MSGSEWEQSREQAEQEQRRGDGTWGIAQELWSMIHPEYQPSQLEQPAAEGDSQGPSQSSTSSSRGSGPPRGRPRGRPPGRGRPRGSQPPRGTVRPRGRPRSSQPSGGMARGGRRGRPSSRAARDQPQSTPTSQHGRERSRHTQVQRRSYSHPALRPRDQLRETQQDNTDSNASNREEDEGASTPGEDGHLAGDP